MYALILTIVFGAGNMDTSLRFDSVERCEKAAAAWTKAMADTGTRPTSTAAVCVKLTLF